MNELATLSSAVNNAWILAYPGSDRVTDIRALCNRVEKLALDRADWIKNARALQADNNKLRGTL